MSKTLYVGGVNYDASEDDIRALFAVKDEEGNVTNIASVRVIDKTDDMGKRKKFAFVEMNTEEEAQAALAMDGQDLLGRPVAVRIAEDRAPRTGGFSGGNRSGGFGGGRSGGNFAPRNGGRRDYGNDRGGNNSW